MTKWLFKAFQLQRQRLIIVSKYIIKYNICFFFFCNSKTILIDLPGIIWVIRKIIIVSINNKLIIPMIRAITIV